jgi:hypothetical protein
MSLDVRKIVAELPAYAGTKVFVDLGKRAGLAGSETEPLYKGSLTPEKAMLGVARFVASYLLLQFVASVGFFYNAASAVGKGVGSIYASNTDVQVYGKTGRELSNEAKQHAVEAVIDYAVKTFCLFAVIAYAVAPDLANRAFARIDEMVVKMTESRAPRVSASDHPGV